MKYIIQKYQSQNYRKRNTNQPKISALPKYVREATYLSSMKEWGITESYILAIKHYLDNLNTKRGFDSSFIF